jgi:hypothetical protein
MLKRRPYTISQKYLCPTLCLCKRYTCIVLINMQYTPVYMMNDFIQKHSLKETDPNYQVMTTHDE